MTELDKEEKNILHIFDNDQLASSADADEQIALAKQAAKKYIGDQKTANSKIELRKN